MLENSLKDNGCKARDRRNTWCIARLSNVADAAFGQYRAIQNANAASETRDRLREKHRQSLVDCRAFLNADHVPRPSQRCFRLKPRIVRGCPGRIEQCWGFFRYPLGYAPHTKWFEVFIADNGAAILPN